MKEDFEKDVEKNIENKINENRKFHAVLLVTILILLFILAFVIKLSNDKKQEIVSAVENNDIVVNNEKIRNEAVNLKGNVVESENNLETEGDTKIDSKTTNFNQEVIDNLNEKEVIELVKVIDNKDNTVTLNLRKYTKSKVPKLTEMQYNELIKNNEIELFNETFTYNPRVNVLTNNKYMWVLRPGSFLLQNSFLKTLLHPFPCFPYIL